LIFLPWAVGAAVEVAEAVVGLASLVTAEAAVSSWAVVGVSVWLCNWFGRRRPWNAPGRLRAG